MDIGRGEAAASGKTAAGALAGVGVSAIVGALGPEPDRTAGPVGRLPCGGTPSASVRAKVNSLHEGKRCSGALLNARTRTGPIPEGKSGFKLSGSGTGSCTCWYRRDVVSPSNG